MSRPIAYLGDIFRLQPRGGINRYFVEIIPRLRREALLIAGVHVSGELDALGDRVRLGARVPPLGLVRRLAAPANAAADRWALARHPRAIVHPTYYRDPRGLPATTPVVVTVHDLARERLAHLFPQRRRWWSRPDAARHQRALCARADRVLCNSRATRDDVVERLGVPAERTRVVHHAGRDWGPIEPRRVAGISRPFFLWVGARAGYKNFAASAAAWARCADARDTQLLCIGGGPLEPGERRGLEALGALGRVRQREATDGELRWAYEHAEGLLYTALWEGFGLPVLEALALGCAVVTSDRPALREVGGDAVLYAEPESADSLDEAIRRCRAGGRAGARAAAGRARAAEFSWDACAAGVERVYEELD